MSLHNSRAIMKDVVRKPFRAVGVLLLLGLILRFVVELAPVHRRPRDERWTGKQIRKVEQLSSKEFVFAAAVSAYADDDRLIYLASADSSYLSLAINLHETSFKKLGITNYLFACSDLACVNGLHKRAIHSTYYIAEKDSHTPSNYTSKAFSRKTHLKTKITLDALLLGFTVIIIDVDIVLFKDPLPHMNCSECDIQIQSDVAGKNSGFYMVRPSEAAIRLHRQAWQTAVKDGESRSNQTVLNSIIANMSRQSLLKVNTLPVALFPAGMVYFDDRHRMFYSANPPKVEVLVHNNNIVSKAAKIYRFKEHLLWMVDTDGYYSDTARKYLAYDNVPGCQDLDAVTEALKAALLIGHLLQRTVILPTFSCKNCKFEVCQVQSQNYPFNTHFNIALFDSYYENKYREHMFLHHPLVPKSVLRESVTFLILPSDGNADRVTPDVEILTPTDQKGPTEDEILKWFSQIKVPVLRFHSLYGIYPNFSNRSYICDEAFNRTI